MHNHNYTLLEAMARKRSGVSRRALSTSIQ